MRSPGLLKKLGDLNPLAGLADLLEDADIFPYEQIPHFPVSTVHGHKSRMLFGLYQNIEVLVMQGRFHAYEGYPLGQVRNLRILSNFWAIIKEKLLRKLYKNFCILHIKKE